jgi:hypothetical protein
MMALADSLNTPKASAFLSGKGLPPTPKGYVGVQEIGPVKEELAQARSKAEKDVGMADINIEKEKQAQTIRDLEGQQVLAQKSAEDVRGLPEREKLKTKREEFTDMKFVPTKDTAQDIAGLFSLVNVIGMAMGGGGKQSAQQAMYAMNGMLEGYQKGRGDLYKKEKESFDKNFKAMQESIKTLEKDYEEAVKMYQYDKDAAEIARKLALAKNGGSIFKAMEGRVGVIGTLNAIKDTVTSVDKAVEVQNKLQEAEDKRKTAADEKRAARDLQLQIAKIRAGGTGGGALPKDKETNNEHRFRYSAIQNVGEVLDELKKPEVRALIGPQNQFTPDVILNLQKGFPELAQKLARFQSEEFKIGGKALTQSEQRILGPIYNWRGLTARALEENLTEAERAMGKEQMYLENRYPGLAQFNYGLTPTPATPTAPSVTPQTERGKDEQGSFHYEYNADRTKRRKVYD